MNSIQQPLRAAIIGMGGFAARHHAAMRGLAWGQSGGRAQAEDVTRLEAVVAAQVARFD